MINQASPIGIGGVQCAPYGVALAAQIRQNAVRPLHLLCAFWPSNGLAHAEGPARVCRQVICQELCAPTGVHPHHRIDVC